MSLFTVGARLDDAEQPVLLDARRFNRHTFWVGQSGSGKTYALGVVLEQLLLRTNLPLLILDPNADFVRLGETRPGADPEAAERIAAADIRVLRSGDGPGERLHVRYLDLAPSSKAAVLQLDPVFDAAEYNAPRDLTELAQVFGFAPESAIRQSAGFRQGQALFAGGFIAEPAFVQMGARLTEEAGGDVAVPLR